MNRKELQKTLSRLPREKREELLEAAEAARQAKQREAILAYNNPAVIGEAKVHKIQVQFHQSQKKLRLFFGGNRCLAEGTAVLIPGGKWQAIETLKPGDVVMTVDPDTRKLLPVPVSEVFDNGEQEVHRFLASHKHGRKRPLWCTPNHHILTQRGLEPAGAIDSFAELAPPDYAAPSPAGDAIIFLLGMSLPAMRLVGHRPVLDLNSNELSLLKRQCQKLGNGVLSSARRLADGKVEVYGRLAQLLRNQEQCEALFERMGEEDLIAFLSGAVRHLEPAKHKTLKVTCGSEVASSLICRALQRIGCYRPEFRGKDVILTCKQDCALLKEKLRLPGDAVRLLEYGIIDLSPARPPISQWLGPSKPEHTRIRRTFDLKLSGGHNLFVAEGCIVSNSGKTEAGAVEAIWFATGTHPYRDIRTPNSGRIIVESLELLEQDILPKFKRWAPNFSSWEAIKGHQGKIAGWRLPNGSRIDVYTFNQESAKLEGTSIRWCWINEPAGREHVVATRRGLIDQDGDLWFTLTPLSEPWMYDEMVIPIKAGKMPIADFFEATPYDNPWLSPEAIKEWEASLEPDEREARIHGRFRHLTGLVFKNFDMNKHVIPTADFPNQWEVTVGIDPHLRKNQIAVFVGRTKHDWLVALAEVSYPGNSLEEFAYEIAKVAKERGFNITAIVADSFIQQPDLVRRDIEPLHILDRVFEEVGLPRVKIASKKDTVIPFITEMKRLLNPIPWPAFPANADGTPYVGPSFLVMDCCTGLIKDFMSYTYQTSRRPELTGPNENPIKKYDDFLDAAKYALLGDPQTKQRLRPRIPLSLETYGLNKGKF